MDLLVLILHTVLPADETAQTLHLTFIPNNGDSDCDASEISSVHLKFFCTDGSEKQQGLQYNLRIPIR